MAKSETVLRESMLISLLSCSKGLQGTYLIKRNWGNAGRSHCVKHAVTWPFPLFFHGMLERRKKMKSSYDFALKVWRHFSDLHSTRKSWVDLTISPFLYPQHQTCEMNRCYVLRFLRDYTQALSQHAETVRYVNSDITAQLPTGCAYFSALCWMGMGGGQPFSRRNRL